MTTFILLRHGQTDWNANHQYQGQADIPLNVTGKLQAVAAREEMRKYTYDAVYCSDLYRARETAWLALQGVYPYEQIHFDARLRERSFGIYEGGCYDHEKMPAEYLEAMAKDPEGFKFPEGESLLDVEKRITPFYHELLEKYPEKTVGIVAHGSLLSVLMLVMRGEPVLDGTRMRLKNAQPFRIEGF